jgi:hypothetical protein
MANRKTSDLTALTTPATGDLLPIVDISEAAAADKNKKITFGELFASIPLGSAAAPSIAFEGDINTGIYSPGADQIGIATGGTSRIVVDASGRLLVDVSANANGGILQLSSGITFPATAVAASDANTLDDYEEGTWTGTDGSGAGLSIAFVGGRYTKIGRLVYVSAETITYPVTANTSNAALAGLPFTNGGQNTGVAALISTNVNANRALVVANTTTAFFYANSSLTTTTNVQLSSAIIYAFTAVYQV